MIVRIAAIATLATLVAVAAADPDAPNPSPPDKPGGPSTAPPPADPAGSAAPPINGVCWFRDVKDCIPIFPEPKGSIGSDESPQLVAAPLRPEDQRVDLAPIDTMGGSAAKLQPAIAITAPPRAPVAYTASGFIAGYGYSGHPSRVGGMQTQLRGDVWRGVEWGAHVAYTVDVLSGNDNDSTTGDHAEGFHDVNLGGSVALAVRGMPAWAFGELHLLAGSTVYGTGEAGFAGVGVRIADLYKVEAGVGGMWTSGDDGLTVWLRAERERITPWLAASLQLLYTNDDPVNMYAGSGDGKLAYGGAVTLGPWRRFTVVLDALFGSRAFSLIDRGQIVENVPDVERTMLRAFVWLQITPEMRGYVGGSYRRGQAEELSMAVPEDYTLASGFTGLVYNF
jgi:hypothetical protein